MEANHTVNFVQLTVADQHGHMLFQQALPYLQGANVQSYLELAVNTSGTNEINFGLQYFGTYQASPLGYLVNMINGVYDAPNSGVYWAFYYNGQLASNGVDYVMPAPGSQVVFQQTAYNAEAHDGTLLHTKHQQFHTNQVLMQKDAHDSEAINLCAYVGSVARSGLTFNINGGASGAGTYTEVSANELIIDGTIDLGLIGKKSVKLTLQNGVAKITGDVTTQGKYRVQNYWLVIGLDGVPGNITMWRSTDRPAVTDLQYLLTKAHLTPRSS